MVLAEVLSAIYIYYYNTETNVIFRLEHFIHIIGLHQICHIQYWTLSCAWFSLVIVEMCSWPVLTRVLRTTSLSVNGPQKKCYCASEVCAEYIALCCWARTTCYLYPWAVLFYRCFKNVYSCFVRVNVIGYFIAYIWLHVFLRDLSPIYHQCYTHVYNWCPSTHLLQGRARYINISV